MLERFHDTTALRYWFMAVRKAITTKAMTGCMSIYPAFLPAPHPQRDDCLAVKGVSALDSVVKRVDHHTFCCCYCFFPT